MSSGTGSGTRHCSALLVAAPASGQGKTTVTAALARAYREQGLHVRVFKTGPDYLDPMILERASGAPVYQLDLWMGDEAHCRNLLYQAAQSADRILIEGVMGLFDGEPSSADLAERFGIPVLLVIDGSAMAQTFGAIVHGLASYRESLRVAGVFANRLGGEAHFAMLRESLPAGIEAIGWLPRDPKIALPERHLGLTRADEIADLDARLGNAARAIGDLMRNPSPTVAFDAVAQEAIPRLLEGRRIAVARDSAFCFLYRANLDLLQALGAELVFFSPLSDASLPEADALYLPGGYPELYLDELAANHRMQRAIHVHHAENKPIVAECGGLMFLLESLSDASGRMREMIGLLPGHARMNDRLANLGLHSAELPEGELRGHTFHYSSLDGAGEALLYSKAKRHHGRPEPVFRLGRLTASYLHWYFRSNPLASARLFLPGGFA